MRPVRPSHRRTLGLVLRVCAGFVAAAVGVEAVGPLGSAGATETTPPSAFGPYPSQYIVAMRNAYASKSFHEVQTIVSKGWKSVNSEDAIVNGGTETDVISELGTRFGFTATLVRDRLYLNADQETLVTIGGLSAFNGGLNAGKWLVVPQRASIYGELAIGIDVQSGIDQIALAAPVSIGPITTFRGQKVVELTSPWGLHASTSQGLQRGQFALFVSVGPHPLPVAEVVEDSIAKIAQTVTLVLSRWDRPVSLATPKNTRPLP